MKIKDLLDKIPENEIINCDISEKSKSSILEHATEYLQHAISGSLVFFKSSLTEQESSKLIKKYSRADSSKFIFVSIKPLSCEFQFIQVQESFFEKLKVLVSDELYPKAEFKLIAVTGTNGKTSVVNIASKLLNEIGIKAISIGTIGVLEGDKVLEQETLNSSLAYVDLRRIIHQYKADCYLVEATSHALVQKRFKELKFDHIYWTNFSQDHLDYHKNMQEYFLAKMEIFNCLSNKIDSKSSRNSKETAIEIMIGDDSLKTKIKEKLPEVCFRVKDENFTRAFTGEDLTGYTKENFSMAYDIVKVLTNREVKFGDWRDYLPEGRFEIIYEKNLTFIIDYAHTPDALKAVLLETKLRFPSKKVIVVFGCGGNRDKTKRALMGSVASEFSDEIILTSDNPRDEEIGSILEDVKQGVKKEILKSKTKSLPSRQDAIAFAVNIASKENIVLIAGKGHENYQEIKGVKYPFKDKDILKQEILNRN